MQTQGVTCASDEAAPPLGSLSLLNEGGQAASVFGPLGPPGLTVWRWPRPAHTRALSQVL